MIKCDHCGQLIPDDSRFCPKCGAKVEKPLYCRHCGSRMSPDDRICPSCGAPSDFGGDTYDWTETREEVAGIFKAGPSGKSRGIAALLAIFLGCFGIHFFYLGKTGAGFVNLAVTLLGSFTVVGPLVIGVISVVQGIRMLTMTTGEFESRYIHTHDFYPLL